MTPKSFDVLAFLVVNAGQLVEKEELMRAVWPDTFVEEANLARVIHTLRKALGDDGNGNKFIETIAKKGYRFVAETCRADANGAERLLLDQPLSMQSRWLPIVQGLRSRPTLRQAFVRCLYAID